MPTAKVIFDEIALKELRQGHCARCGERTRRTIRVFQTVNPWNRGPAGRPKTVDEIRTELLEELVAERRKPLYCQRCEHWRAAEGARSSAES